MNHIKTRQASRRGVIPGFYINSFGRGIAFSLAIGLACSFASAALVANWTERTGLAPVSNMATASPTLGNGTANSADAMSIYATIPTVSLTSVGDKVTLSGSATLAGIASSANQFRWALYDANGSSNDTGWLGYIGSQGAATSGANLLERANPNTVWYMSGTGGANVTIDTATAPNTGFSDGTYDFSLTLELTASGIRIDSSIIRTSDSQQFGLISFEDTTPQTTTFNRVAFLVGGVLDADQVQFFDIDVAYTAIPEPSTATIGLLLGTLVLRRRRC